MNPTWAPTDVPVATRGEFLAHRATAVHELERRIGSPSGLLGNCGLVFGAAFAVMMAGAALSDARVEAFHVVFAVVMAAGALASVPLMARRTLRTRKLMAVLLAWETAEQQARSLPPGHVKPDLRMPFDARQDADFESVAHVAEVTDEFRPSAGWLLARAVPAGLGIPLGLVGVLGGPGFESAAMGIAFFVAGAYLLICCLVAAVGANRMAWRLRRIWKERKAETQAWRAGRIGPVAAAEVDRAWRRQRWHIAAPFIAAPVLGFVVGGTTSSAAAVPVVVVIVVLAGLVIDVVVVALWRRRRTPVPAEHHITAVPPG